LNVILTTYIKLEVIASTKCIGCDSKLGIKMNCASKNYDPQKESKEKSTKNFKRYIVAAKPEVGDQALVAKTPGQSPLQSVNVVRQSPYPGMRSPYTGMRSNPGSPYTVTDTGGSPSNGRTNGSPPMVDHSHTMRMDMKISRMMMGIPVTVDRNKSANRNGGKRGKRVLTELAEVVGTRSQGKVVQHSAQQNAQQSRSVQQSAQHHAAQQNEVERDSARIRDVIGDVVGGGGYLADEFEQENYLDSISGIQGGEMDGYGGYEEGTAYAQPGETDLQDAVGAVDFLGREINLSQGYAPVSGETH
jgi:hypothetical protein